MNAAGMRVSFHPDPGVKAFLKRTVAAQLHLAATVAAAVGVWVLASAAAKAPGAAHLRACLAFGVTGVALFTASTTYHFVTDGFAASERLHDFLEDLDHFAIYLFIAGSYTPFLLNAVAPPWEVPLMAAIWTLAVLGIAYTHLKPRLPEWARRRSLYTSIFVVMGWVMVVRIGEVFHRLTPFSLFLLLAGALSYTLGAVVYATRRPRLLPGLFGFHELWHASVVAGFAFHYFLILGFYRR